MTPQMRGRTAAPIEKPQRFHWFAYHAAPWETKAFFRKRSGTTNAARILHQTRDATAFLEIAQLLGSRNYDYVGPLFNVPSTLFHEGERPEDLGEILRKATSSFKSRGHH